MWTVLRFKISRLSKKIYNRDITMPVDPYFFLVADLLDEDFFEADFFEADFFEADFFEADFFEADFLEPDFFGTFAPDSLASESPIAIACLRLVTFLPLLPLFNVPSFFSCMAFSTLSPAFFEYFAIK
jgi:hypothetical protein